MRSDPDPPPDDPICAFMWPGILAHCILPPTQQPDTLQDWFNQLKTSPFTYSHNITIHSDTVNVYAWTTETNNITETREIGITANTHRLYYLNWWRSEPYPGELINRRTMLRLLPDDKR